jgi:Zn-dependent peptidase ImmA (M78 family)
MSDLITAQGIWTSGAHLPDEIAGLFLSDPAIGLFIIVNFAHPRSRKRFSYAHEYCHALLDRSRELTVTTEANRSEPIEVRANAFAAALLMPRNGVSAFLANRCKAGPSRFEQQVYDVATEKTGPQVKAQKRSSPGAQTITFEDVAALAHHFGVSYQAAAYRLKSLSVVNQDEVGSLLQKEPIGRDYLRLLHMLEDLEGNDNQKKPDRDLVRQVVHLAVEAYRREEISKGRLRDLSVLLKIPARDLLALAEAA